jgi:hypothetical protein
MFRTCPALRFMLLAHRNSSPFMIRLDSIGMAGFSHDFESLKGKSPPVVAALDSFGSVNQSDLSLVLLFLSQLFPSLSGIPTERLTTLRNIVASINSFAGRIMESEKEADVSTDKSIIATLGMLNSSLAWIYTNVSSVRSENVTSPSIRMSKDEIMAQVYSSNWSAEFMLIFPS